MNAYTFHITPYDLAFLGAIFIGFFLALQMGFAKRINRAANRFLSLALATMVLWQFGILGRDIGLAVYFPHWSWLPLQFSLVVGPLIYFYMLKIIHPEYKFRVKNLLHFSPLLLEFGAQLLEVKESIRTGAATYNTVTFHELNPALQLLAFISAGIYLYASFKLVEQFYRGLKFNGGDRHRYELRWLYNLLIGFSLLWLLWIPFTAVANLYYQNAPGIYTYYPLYALLSVMAILLAAVAFLRQETNVPADAPSFLKPPLPAEMKQRGNWLRKTMQAGLYYRDPELSLVSLAEKLNLTTHELSRIINTVLKKSFNDFINEFRVAEVARKMQDPAYDHITLLGIAFESGFNSQSTFTRAFKHMTGKSPLEYKNDLKKDWSSYNLNSHQQFAPVILRRETPPMWSHEKLTGNYMFKNYFKIASRILTKQKTLSFINVFGMSVGIACFSLLMLYAIAEFSFDSFHKNAADIYMVINSGKEANTNGISGSIYTPMPLGPAMKQDLPGVEDYVRYIQPYGTFLKVNNQGRREDISFADPSFFKVFSFKFKYGNAKSALGDLHSVVLTEETAKRLFGEENAVGKSVRIKVENTFEPFFVSAIAENPPPNSIFQFSMVASFDCFANTAEGKMSANVWGWNSYMTLVQLKSGNALAHNSKLMAAFREKHVGKGAGSEGQYTLEPLRDAHTNPALTGVKVAAADPKTIWILLSIAAGVLFIACINFTTLSIGRSAGRAKEIGVRKVIGGTKKALVFQFLTESLLLASLSTVIGFSLANLALPFFNHLSGMELSFSFAQFPQLYALIAGLVVIVGLLAGCYPALILSGFNAAEALKAKIKLGGSNFFTKSLVTFQFVLSAALITSSVIIVQQLHFMQSRNPGFEKANILDVKTLGVSNTKSLYPLFVHELTLRPEIAGLTSSDNGLGENGGINITGFNYHQKPVSVAQYHIDPDYLQTLGMHLLAGRDFDRNIAADTVNSVIINEALMRELGWTLENSTGQYLEGYNNFGVKNPIVIGVVRDFNYQDLTHQVQPLIFHQFSSPMIAPFHFFVRIRPGDPSRALDAVRSAWKKIAPEYPLQYNFLDEDIDRFFKSETRLSNIIGWAGGIAIFLACLGLLGLAALSVVNRTKEIGIRKVLGASVSTILGLISKDFVRLVVVAFLIAIPATWWLMNKWLENYAYRIRIDWAVFGLSGAAIIFLALLTVCVQGLKAAIANPVKSLRTE